MTIYDPIARALGIPETIDVSCYDKLINDEDYEKNRLSNSLLATEWNKQRLEDGTHNFLHQTFEERSKRQKEKVRNGTHPFIGIKNPTYKRIEDGTHNFIGETNPTTIKMKNGTHHFQDDRNPAKKVWTCEHCNVSGSGLGNYSRYHGNKCKKLLTYEKNVL